MAGKKQGKTTPKQLAVFFLEGYSEEVFYRKILTMYLNGIPKLLVNVKGLYNIHKIVMGKSVEIASRYPDYKIRIYCCIDRESRDKAPELDIQALRNDIFANHALKNKVLSADLIIATQMLESWFFHDIDGIYKFLRTPKTSRNSGRYKLVEKTTWHDLYKLFKDAGKFYMKGERSENFIDHLDLKKIYDSSAELRAGIENVALKSAVFESDI